MERRYAFVVVLGYGQVGLTLNNPTERRLFRALELIRQLSAEGKRVALIFPTGNGTGESRTMALDMKRYVEHVGTGVGHGFEIVANVHRPEVWGTIAEMRWAEAQARMFCNMPELIFVTNARHARRIRVTNRSVTKIPNVSTVESDDHPSCWYHEALAYGKLVLHRFGNSELVERIEHLRRRYYKAG